MMVVVFSYISISRNFINRQAQENIENYTMTYATRMSAQLDMDYQLFKNEIIRIENESLDPILELDASGLKAFGFPYVGFATIVDRTFTYQGNTYYFTDDFESVDYDQVISIYSLNEAFEIENDTQYIFFKYEEYVGFIDAKSYLDLIMSTSANHIHFLIVYEDNLITYKSFDHSVRFLFDYIDIYRENPIIEDLMNDFVTGQTGSIRHTFLNLDSMISYSPLSETFSTKQIFLVLTYDSEVMIGSMSYLTNVLWAVFFVIFILFSGGLVLLFKIIESKVNDIEIARLTHYYAKPYMMRIRKSGKIIGYNRSLKTLLGEFDVYNDVRDLKILNESGADIIEGLIKRQFAFTALIDLGKPKPTFIRFIPIKTAGGYYLIGDDVSNIEGKFNEYKDLAMYNLITKLPNRNSMMSDLEDFFKDKELLEKRNIALVVDVISFNKISLLLGEKTSERFIAVIANIIRDTILNHNVTMYHVETDQFAFLFKDIGNPKDISRWTDQLFTKFDVPMNFDKNLINVELKIGIFHIDRSRYEILNPEVVYDNMMLALNHAKESAIYKEFEYDVSLSVIASREQRMEQDLAEAILNNEFYMALQPQYNNKEEKIVGFEALIRWNNPKYVNESPLKFIQMAERNNMIIDIGRIALHETFSIAKRMEKYGVKISLNISPVQILQAGFVNEIISVFEQYDLKKHSITLEITETFLITSFELIINKLKLLQKYGFDIHLDDFGTGYSSLQYLRDLPINAIKIDRAFVINLETDNYSRAIVTMITNLAKSIDIEVITEGIEDLKQNAILQKAGCHVIQGYLISPALVEKDAIQLIEDFNVNKTRKLEQPKVKSGKETKR